MKTSKNFTTWSDPVSALLEIENKIQNGAGFHRKPGTMLTKYRCHLHATESFLSGKKILYPPICFRLEGGQPKPTVNFRGQAYFCCHEKMHGTESLSCSSQKPGQTEFGNKWAAEHFGKWSQEAHGEAETLLFCDGLDSHKTPEFPDRLRRNNCFRLVSPPDCTM